MRPSTPSGGKAAGPKPFVPTHTESDRKALVEGTRIVTPVPCLAQNKIRTLEAECGIVAVS